MKRKALSILILSVLVFSLIPITQAFAVSITSLSASSGDEGDTITVSGDGVTAGVNVEVYWDAVKAWDGKKGLLNSTEAGAAGDFEVNFDVPEAVNGAHYIWVKDTGTGETYGGAAVMNSLFDVDAKLSLSPSAGLEDDTIVMTGYGFGSEVEIVTVTFDGMAMTPDPSAPETNTLGTWSAELVVPDVGGVYGGYTVYVEDEDGNSAVATFTVGASVTFDVAVGRTGTVVEVSGRGFLGTEVTSIMIDGTACALVDTIEIEDGEFTGEFVIPSVAGTGDYTVTVTDDMATSATEDFEVDGLAEVTTTPDYGVQGSTIAISGENFTEGEDVTVTVAGADVGKTFTPGSDGSFSGTFTVPAVASGMATLMAEQVGFGIMDDVGFKVGLIITIIAPGSGETGSKATLTGSGFSESSGWNATFGDEVIFEDMMTESDGTLSEWFYVPSVAVGTYLITVTDEATEIEVETEFEVTDTVALSLDPAEAPNDYNVTMDGMFFSDDEGASLDVVLYNSTMDIDIDLQTNSPTVLDEDGNFTGWFLVPGSDDLSVGDYTINVTDANDLMGQIAFKVVSKLVDIEPRKAQFNIGSTVAFDIESSFSQDNSYIKIWDPDGALAWQSDALVASSWIKVGYNVVVPYFKQTANGNPMVIDEDAVIGTWTWTWYDAGGDELDSGSFIVNPATEELLSEQILALSEDVSGLSEDFEDLSGDVAGVKSDVAGVKSDVASVKSDVASVKSDVSGIGGKADAAKSAADSAKSAADAAKSAADDAKTASSGLSTLVYGAIGASLIAALAAIVALMQISRKIA